MFWWDHSHSEACFPPLCLLFHSTLMTESPSVSTTLGYNILASEESIRSSPAARCGCERGEAAAIIVCVWMALSVSHSAQWAASYCLFSGRAALLLCLIVAPVELNRLLLPGLRDSLPCSPGKKKGERSENQFLIKQICKGCIKRCSTFALAQLSVWCDLENAMRRLTNSVHACWGRRCCFCLTLDW